MSKKTRRDNQIESVQNTVHVSLKLLHLLVDKTLNLSTYTKECVTLLGVRADILSQRIDLLEAQNKDKTKEEPKNDKSKDYRQAVGAAPGFLGNTLPEDAIRKGR